jgi:DNA polymerase epsilon subunit 1
LAWLQYHKKKWALQAKQRAERESFEKRARIGHSVEGHGQAGCLQAIGRNPAAGALGGFLRRAQRTLLDTPWQIIQVAVMGNHILIF